MSTPETTPVERTTSRTESAQNAADLEECERSDGRPAFYLTVTEAKLLGIAGVGFFLDGEHIGLTATGVC